MYGTRGRTHPGVASKPVWNSLVSGALDPLSPGSTANAHQALLIPPSSLGDPLRPNRPPPPRCHFPLCIPPPTPQPPPHPPTYPQPWHTLSGITYQTGCLYFAPLLPPYTHLEDRNLRRFVSNTHTFTLTTSKDPFAVPPYSPPSGHSCLVPI